MESDLLDGPSAWPQKGNEISYQISRIRERVSGKTSIPTSRREDQVLACLCAQMCVRMRSREKERECVLVHAA